MHLRPVILYDVKIKVFGVYLIVADAVVEKIANLIDGA